MTVRGPSILTPLHIVRFVYYTLYNGVQNITLAFLTPRPPSTARLEKPREGVAIVGAGLTSVSSAAFDVVPYDEENLSAGRIWSHMNSTSGLQLNSVLNPSFPGVKWRNAFLSRDENVSDITGIREEHALEARARLDGGVKNIREGLSSTGPAKGDCAHSLVNDVSDGVSDGVLVTIEAYDEPNMISFPHQNKYHGRIIHSSELDTLSSDDIQGSNVLVVGSGSSGVESVEFAVKKGAKNIHIIARNDEWIIPRNIMFDIMLLMQLFGRELPLSFIPEFLLKKYHYRDLKALSPSHKGFYECTPIVNDDFLAHIRSGLVTYVRGDTHEFTEKGLHVNVRGEVWDHGQSMTYTNWAGLSPCDFGEGGRHTKPDDVGETHEMEADIVILATGFKQPSVFLLPKDVFPDRCEHPNLCLQNFSTQ